MATSFDYANTEDYERFGYSIGNYHDFITAKLHEVSEQLRQEARARYYLIDERFSNDEDWCEVVKSVVCKIVYNLVQSRSDLDAQIGTEYEGIDSISYSSGAQGYSESKSLHFRSGADMSTSYIPRRALEALGIGVQKIARETF